MYPSGTSFSTCQNCSKYFRNFEKLEAPPHSKRTLLCNCIATMRWQFRAVRETSQRSLLSLCAWQNAGQAEPRKHQLCPSSEHGLCLPHRSNWLTQDSSGLRTIYSQTKCCDLDQVTASKDEEELYPSDTPWACAFWLSPNSNWGPASRHHPLHKIPEAKVWW